MKQSTRYKYIISFFVLISLLLQIVSPAISQIYAESYAADYKTYKDIPGVTAGEISSVQKLLKKYDEFSYVITYSTEAFFDTNNNPAGFSSGFCKKLSQLFGTDFKVNIVEWDTLWAGLNSKKYDFSGELTATPEREKDFYMTSSIAERTVKMFTDSRDGEDGSVPHRSTPVYAFLRGTITCDSMKEVSEEEFDVIYVETYEEVIKYFEENKIDAFFDENSAEAAFDEYSFVECRDYFPLLYSTVSLSTGNEELEPIINIVQKYLDNGGTEELSEIYAQGSSEYIVYNLYNRLNDEEKAYVKEHLSSGKAIPFAAEFDNYPSCFYNDQEGEFQGIAIDVLSEISKITGLEFEPVNSVNTEWMELLTILDSGEASLITELVYSDERAEKYLWPNKPYNSDNFALLSKADTPDIELHQVLYAPIGLVRDSSSAEMYYDWFPNNPHVTVYENKEEAFAALEKNDIDYLMATQNMLLSITNYMEQPGYKASLTFNRTYDSTFGFNINETELCSIIEKSQAMIDKDVISQRWTHKVFDYKSEMLRDLMPIFIGASIILLLGLIMVLFLFFKNRKMSKNLESIVRDRTRELEIQTEAAHVASNAKSDFLSRMSHEIRTPLNAIMGMTQIAKDSIENKTKVKKSIKEIDSASSHLMGILNDVLDMSKIEAGKFIIAEDAFSLKIAMEEVSSIIEQRCMEKSVIFIKMLDTIPETLYVEGDKMRLKQVLINLLGNAVKFSPENGEVKFSVILKEDKSDRVNIRFMVEDNGIGMTEDQVKNLFIPFEQADMTISSRFGGTGLGLAISQNLVNLMGGEITAESALDQGSKFSFLLQMQKSSEQIEKIPEEAISDLDLEGRCILVAEDIEINREILKEFLAHTGVELEFACDGLEAVDMFNDHPERYYDLIFMDIQMPVKNGYEATEEIRFAEKIRSSKIPIIAMTANAYKEDIDRCLEAGMNGHVAKPVDISELMNAIVKWLDIEI